MAKTKFDWKPYPEPDAQRTGCKVSWYCYRDRADAEKASIAAKHNAVRQEQLGYDFGYMMPGSITLLIKGDDRMWEVCIP